MVYLTYEVRAARREGPKNFVSECVCVLKQKKEGGERDHISQTEGRGGGQDYRGKRD